MDEEEKKPKVLVPEVVKPEDKDSLLPQKKQRNDLAEVASKPRRFPIFNRLEQKRIESFTKVVQAETQLVGALIDHSKSRDRFHHLSTEIQTDRLTREADLEEAQKKLRELKRESGQAQNDDEIASLRRQLEKAELEKRLRTLQNPEGEKTLEQKLTEDEQKAVLKEKWRVKTAIDKITTVQRVKEEEIERYQKRIKEIESNPGLTEDEKENQKRELERIILAIEQNV